MKNKIFYTYYIIKIILLINISIIMSLISTQYEDDCLPNSIPELKRSDNSLIIDGILNNNNNMENFEDDDDDEYNQTTIDDEHCTN